MSTYRNDMLTAEIYPDSDNFEDSSGFLQNGPSGLVDRVEFQYNRTGERMRMRKRDQNSSIHTYEYDNLGRLIHDRITTLGSTVDGAVRRISTEYTVTGQAKLITSYDNATVGSGGIVNQIAYTYDENGQLSREYTAHDGAVDLLTTPFIEYEYDSVENGLRLLTQVYPSGKRVGYEYDEYGRIDAILDGNNVLVEYGYSGSGTALRTKYVEPNLTLDYTVPGALDRFGRVADHAWMRGNDPLVHIQHGYDRVGNRLYRLDAVHAPNSELYSYDGVNQIKSLSRGVLNANKDAVPSPNFTEAWNFDATGNWMQYDKNGTVENRTPNAANELQGIATHDANGNMVLMPDLKTKYDAWNRIVEVCDSSDNLIARYDYNGSNQRIQKTVGSSVTKSFFNKQWQELESVTGSELTTYVWGLRYIDDLVLREKGEERLYSLADPNWNVVALIDSTGSVQERMKYDAFGKVTWMDENFVAKANSDFAWNRTFTGQVFDVETGMIQCKNRYYHIELGRFISRDPIGYLASDNNLYRYVINTPQNKRDVYGLTAKTALPGLPFDNTPGKPAGSGDCSVAVHCWMIKRGPEGWEVPIGHHHCGLTLVHNGTLSYIDGDGGTTGHLGETTPPSYASVVTGSYVDYKSDTCDCLKKYIKTFNDAGRPRTNLDGGNSNWNLNCLTGKCGLSIDWGKWGEPTGFSKPPCKKWETVVSPGPSCQRICVERHSCP